MHDLLSILFITYMAGGTPIESEIYLAHSQCLAAEQGFARGAAWPRVELFNGRMAPVVSVACVPGCIVDGLEPIPLLATAEG